MCFEHLNINQAVCKFEHFDYSKRHSSTLTGRKALVYDFLHRGGESDSLLIGSDKRKTVYSKVTPPEILALCWCGLLSALTTF